MKFATSIIAALCASLTAAAPTAQSLDLSQYSKRADSSLVGYLGAFFLGDEPSVYFYRSNGNNAISFSALNGGNPVIVPTLGTGGVRDPTIIAGGGDEAGKKWYIIGTDLDISKVKAETQKLNSVSTQTDTNNCRQPGMLPSAPARAAFSSGNRPIW